MVKPVDCVLFFYLVCSAALTSLCESFNLKWLAKEKSQVIRTFYFELFNFLKIKGGSYAKTLSRM